MAESPFVYVNSINDKNRIPVGEGYNKFLMNRQYSLFIDTILYAAEANRFGEDIDAKMSYEFYFNSLRKKKRFTKWPTKQSGDDLKLVCQTYGYSPQKGIEALSLLGKDELEAIREFNKEKNYD